MPKYIANIVATNNNPDHNKIDIVFTVSHLSISLYSPNIVTNHNDTKIISKLMI